MCKCDHRDHELTVAAAAAAAEIVLQQHSLVYIDTQSPSWRNEPIADDALIAEMAVVAADSSAEMGLQSCAEIDSDDHEAEKVVDEMKKAAADGFQVDVVTHPESGRQWCTQHPIQGKHPHFDGDTVAVSPSSQKCHPHHFFWCHAGQQDVVVRLAVGWMLKESEMAEEASEAGEVAESF